jgi:predicted heme/steroid binding protein
MFTFLSENLPTITLILFILIVLWFLKRAVSSPSLDLITGNFTFAQLHEFNGATKPQRFIALKHTIYDVTDSLFYRKLSPYGKFVGYDISVNLAKMSHDEALFNKWESYTLTN